MRHQLVRSSPDNAREGFNRVARIINVIGSNPVSLATPYLPKPLTLVAEMPSQDIVLNSEKDERKETKANEAMHPQVPDEDIFQSRDIRQHTYYADDTTLIFHMEVREALRILHEQNLFVNCIVTSPPFYGQRDYEVDGQVGLEAHPALFIETLLEVFEDCRTVLADNGSLWINIGDTYWSGKGQHRSEESKQNARRFGFRPQDGKGDGKWCVPKQLLLIPHRFAISMQESGWLVRNDNIWRKPHPIPDQVRDRCSISHEYVFHFVKERWYYFDKNSVGRPTESGSMLPPLDTWEVSPVRGRRKGHAARFSEELVRVPILTTTPPRGIVLDPFAGSGTSLTFARKHGFRSIGIDIKEEFCELMKTSFIELAQEEEYENVSE